MEFAIDYIELARMKDELNALPPEPSVAEFLQLIESSNIEIALPEAIKMLELASKTILETSNALEVF